MDHEALEAELQRVEARARARRKRFEAAARDAESEPTTLWRRHQIKLIGIVTVLSAVVPCLLLIQMFSAKPALSEGVSAQSGSELALAGPAISSSSGAGQPAHSDGSATEAATPGDPIENLFARIQERKYDAPGDVAVGPFLRDFAVQVKKVDEIDRSNLRPRRRGVGWTVVLAPLKPDDAVWERPRPPGSLEVRCVKGNGTWKIEQLVAIRRAGT